MWQYALWGLAGAAVNRALVLLEANRRVKGAPWRFPEGPGGRVFALAVALHCGIAAAVTYAAAAFKVIDNPWVAVGLGATVPVAIKTIIRLALEPLASRDPDEVVE
jgi:hypothetical protein